MRPNINTIPEFYKSYVQSVISDDWTNTYTALFEDSLAVFEHMTEEKSRFAYAPGKWTIKDLLQHLIDSERIFAYRALSFSRGDVQKINGYDHDEYVVSAFANKRSFSSLLQEFKNTHQSTKDLFNSFSNEMLQMKGNANGSEIKVIDIIFITMGHQKHHMKVIKERYL